MQRFRKQKGKFANGYTQRLLFLKASCYLSLSLNSQLLIELLGRGGLWQNLEIPTCFPPAPASYVHNMTDPGAINEGRGKEEHSMEQHWSILGLEVLTPTQIQNYRTMHLHELLRKVRADFCLLPCEVSQEPSRTCSDKPVQMNFSLWGD